MQKEIWKDIATYEGLYQISNLGRVKSLDRVVNHKHSGFLTIKGKILNQNTTSKGYKRIDLCKNGKNVKKSVHRLMALYFLKNPLNKSQVNHIDFNPSNNHIDNLEWSTAEENIQHSVDAGRMNGSPILILDKESGVFYDSINDAAISINMIPNRLTCRLVGKIKNNTNFIYA